MPNGLHDKYNWNQHKSIVINCSHNVIKHNLIYNIAAISQL
jgi:hypothetical protein